MLLIVSISVVVLVSAAIGTIIGWLLRGGRVGRSQSLLAPTIQPAPERASQAGRQPVQLQAMLAQLLRQADRISRGIDAHRSHVEKLGCEFAAFGSDASPLGNAVSAASLQLLPAVEQLRGELNAAQSQLRNHAVQIETQLAEARKVDSGNPVNHGAFGEELACRFDAFQREGKLFSLILLEVDPIKQFNDQYGHRARVEVLRGVNQTLLEGVRDCDIVVRFGGEGFAVGLPGCPLFKAQEIAVRLRAALALRRIESRSATLEAAASLGVAQARAGEPFAAVVQRANHALWAAQEYGGNCVYSCNGLHCERIQPCWFEANHDMLEAVEQRLREEQIDGAPIDRRGESRRPFPVRQLIAPYVNGQLPTRGMFVQVLCHDICPGGFSFFVRQPPAHDSLIAALGAPSNMTYLCARIVYVRATDSDSQAMFLVGCRFTGRVDLKIEGPDKMLAAEPASIVEFGE